MLFAANWNENCWTEAEVRINLHHLIFDQAFVGCKCHHQPNVHIQFQFHKSQFQTLEFCTGSYERKISGWIKHRDKQTCTRSIPVPEVSISNPRSLCRKLWKKDIWVDRVQRQTKRCHQLFLKGKHQDLHPYSAHCAQKWLQNCLQNTEPNMMLYDVSTI
jgi:hypothetical protein